LKEYILIYVIDKKWDTLVSNSFPFLLPYRYITISPLNLKLSFGTTLTFSIIVAFTKQKIQ